MYFTVVNLMNASSITKKLAVIRCLTALTIIVAICFDHYCCYLLCKYEKELKPIYKGEIAKVNLGNVVISTLLSQKTS